MSRLLRLTILCVVVLVAPSRPAAACSCGMPPACTAFWQADAVFIGRAQVTQAGAGTQRTRFRIEERFRGPDLDVIEIVSKGIGGSCAFEFVDRSLYLVYANRLQEGGWGASLCSRTMVLDGNADEDLAFARSIARNPAAGGRVYGSASIAERRPEGGLLAIASLASTSVTIQSHNHTFTVQTDARGQYEFNDVPPARYTLTVRLSPRFETFRPVVLTVKGPGACALYGIAVLRRHPQDRPNHVNPQRPTPNS
jgi:hypothetical protein